MKFTNRDKIWCYLGFDLEWISMGNFWALKWRLDSSLERYLLVRRWSKKATTFLKNKSFSGKSSSGQEKWAWEESSLNEKGLSSRIRFFPEDLAFAGDYIIKWFKIKILIELKRRIKIASFEK